MPRFCGMVTGMKELEQDFSHLAWRETSRSTLCDCGIFTVRRSKRESTDGKIGDFVLIDTSDWVTILPVVRDSETECFLMVRQYRHGNGRITLEFPAGVISNGEQPRAAARRELREETGQAASRLVEIGSVNPNPAFMMNTVHTFVAEGLTLAGAQQFDEFENIELVTVPVTEVLENMGTGVYCNGIMMIALAWYLRWSERISFE